MAKPHKKSTLGKNIPRSEDKDNHYVDRKAFYAALVERRNQIKNGENPPVTEFIGECLFSIAKGLSLKHNFIGYSYRDEMVANAVAHCFINVDKFDPDFGNNPFAYFTQLSYYQFLEVIKEEKGEQYVKYAQLLDSSALGEVISQPDEYSNYGVDMGEIDLSNISTIVNDYEVSMQKKSAPAKKKIVGPNLMGDEYEVREDSSEQLSEHLNDFPGLVEYMQESSENYLNEYR